MATRRDRLPKKKTRKKNRKWSVGLNGRNMMLANDDDDDSDIGAYALGVCP